MQKKHKFSSYRPITKAQSELQNRDFYDQDTSVFSARIKRIGFLHAAVVILIFLGLTLRLFELQVKEGFLNLNLAEGNRVKNIPTAGARGLIIDAKDEILANNVASYQLITRISRVADLEKIDSRVFDDIGISRDAVRDEIKKQSSKSVITVLRDKLSREEALLIKSHLPVYGDFEIAPTFLREYREQSLAHVLGYVGKVTPDELSNKPIAAINGISGKSGLERTYDDYLQGNPGSHKAEVDANNRLVRLLTDQEGQIGATLKTTINKQLQNFAYNRLKEITEEKKTQGALVAINPKDGSILAMVSLPVYDNTKLSGGISKDELEKIFNDGSKPFLNRVTSGVYPSGSTIKPFVAATALETGVVSEDTSFETPPFIEIGQWKFPDWKDHGITDVKTAIGQSNNIFFYSLGGGWSGGPIKRGLGPDGIKKGLEKFGFGQKTGIDLSAEEKGFIPTPEWKKKTTGESWYIGNTYNMAIGQGDLLVTPLQIASATSTIANSGKIYRPYLVSQILDKDNKQIASEKSGSKLISENVFSSDSLRIVREGMRKTVLNGGSAWAVFGPDFPVEVAAKTGTAQFGNEEKTHAWFTSFAPYSDPEIVVSVVVEAGGEGYEAAAPVAKDVIKYWSENK